MDLRKLQYFSRVAESESFREAAERANVAQSALSRHVGALENELGVSLFERHARGVCLTPEGLRLKERADRILREVEETKAELTATDTSPCGIVTLGASATSSRLLYARLAEAAVKLYPRIDLNMTEGASYFLLEGLDTGRIDIAVMVDPEPRTYFYTEPLVTEKVYLVSGAGQTDSSPPSCSVKDLKHRPLVLFSRPSGSRALLESTAASSGISLNVRFEAASPDVIKDFVRRGLGYGVMPHSSIFRDITKGELVATEMEGIELTRTFIHRTDRPESPAVNAIAGLVRKEFTALREEGVFGSS